MCQHPCLLMDVHEAPISTLSLHCPWPKEEKKQVLVWQADLGGTFPAAMNAKGVLVVSGVHELAAHSSWPFLSVLAAP
jgi:hypothetical protein